MIYFENLTHLFVVDWNSIENHIKNNLMNLPRAGHEKFAGWAVQSFSGKYTDGWVDGSQFLSRKDGRTFWDSEGARNAGYRHKTEQVHFTDASCPALVDVIQQLADLGFNPLRARLINLRPGDRSSYHTDGPPPILRMHFVIETNTACFFRSEHETAHLPARQVFLINVDDYHQVWNDGTTNRTHLVVDVEDTKGISLLHKR